MTEAPAATSACNERDRTRRAWWVLGGCFLAFTLSASLMHAYTVFLLAFVAEFGWTRAEASIAYSVGQVVGGASSPLAGGLTDRLGPRRMVMLGGCLLALGLLLSAFAQTLWQVVLLYGVVMTLGSNFVGMVVFVPLISRLFATRRGMAVSVLQSANGAGRAISAPVAQMLVGGMGWRNAYLLLGGVLAVLVPLAGLLPRREREPPAAAGAAAALRDWTLAEAAGTWQFWVLGLVYMLTSIGSFLVSLHQMAFATGVGFDPLYAAGVLGLGAFLALPGVIVTGTLSDHIGREAAAVVTYGISIFGVACALFIDDPSQHILFWLHACFFGITWGARGPAITAKTADLFPGPRLGTILGVITIGSGLGAGIGSWAAGASVRPDRVLPPRLLAIDGVLCVGVGRVLDASPTGQALRPPIAAGTSRDGPKARSPPTAVSRGRLGRGVRRLLRPLQPQHQLDQLGPAARGVGNYRD